MKNLIFVFSFFVVSILFATDSNSDKQSRSETYESFFAGEAVRQMEKSGIPASITLAQGMIESGYGLSELAQKSNNHFGIKCHGWTGKSVKYDDDAKDECFRVYDNAFESYDDHTSFLTSRSRYDFLFEYSNTDYKKWAKGLKKAGYATHSKYADMLIEKIEKSELWKYDKMSSKDFHDNEEIEKIEPQIVIFKGEEIPLCNSHEVRLTKRNVRYIVATSGDTFFKLSREFNMSLWQLHCYNDIVGKDCISQGDFIYLQPKSKRYNGKEDKVYSKEETISELSQRLCIRLKTLLKYNPQFNEGQALEEGTEVKLKA
jgi:hypothetical protein